MKEPTPEKFLPPKKEEVKKIKKEEIKEEKRDRKGPRNSGKN
jgi:hypothetical protein